MKKLAKSLSDHQVPPHFTRADWDEATENSFYPFFRRRRQLRKHIDAFHIELRNLARIAKVPEYIELLNWCLRLYRKMLRKDREGSYDNLLNYFDNMQKSDERWQNIFETSSPLESGASIDDRVYQLFTTIDGVSEGCYKPQLQIAFSMSLAYSGAGWRGNVDQEDFGVMVSKFPIALKTEQPILLADPDMGISINQWRNIAAHRSFQIVGPRTVEVQYGKKTVQRKSFGFHRLRRVWHWLLRTHTAVRLANTIIYVEHMPELHGLGITIKDRRLSATLLHIAHQLSTVGFEMRGWKEAGRDGVLVIADRLGRPPLDALIHASQVLDQLSVGIIRDVSKRNRIHNAGVALELADSTVFGTALVSVQIADDFSLKKISMREYMEQIQWLV